MSKFIRANDETKYLVLSGGEEYYFVCNSIRYLIRVKNGTRFVISRNYAKNKINSYDSLPLEETFHNVMTHTQSVWNKNKNNYYNKIFT